jgi:uncharacterized protein YecE (DUF72 family)
MQMAKELKELIDQLPPEFQEEVRDFVGFLLKRKARRPHLSFRKKPWNGKVIDRRGFLRLGFL